VQPWPEVGALFGNSKALDWLDHIAESNSILSAVLAVIHPELHDAGQETFNRLRNHDEIQPQEVIRKWTSVFNGVSVICNRLTPPHRDNNSRRQWYELLVTLGRYQDCNLELPGLGVSLKYGPGTVVGLSGGTMKHAVSHFEGNRVCYAYFMRNSVHRWAGVPGDSWMKTSWYERRGQ
jgi:Oxygenase domain of the 2OGFeDO superfamily